MSGRGWKILLGASLVLNLFVVGAIAGVLILRQQTLAQAGSGDPVMNAADALPTAQREAFRTMISARLQVLRAPLHDARIARRTAMARLGAAPFDRAAAGADLARGRQDDANARGLLEDGILDFAATLPPDQRAALAKGLGHAALVRWMSAHHGEKPPTLSQDR
jgi:uncharacterized membrane protein